jgi:hypothetical protein
MGEYWDLMGRYNAETQAFSAFVGVPNSPYTPRTDGTLIGIRVIVGGEAATSLTEGVRIRLTCSIWTPNQMEVAVSGNGIRTAPAGPLAVFDFSVAQPVRSSQPITLEGMCVEATCVTNSVYVIGKFKC